MSKATERTKQAEVDYKKVFKVRLVERKKEQHDKHLIDGELQSIGIKKAFKRKIKTRRDR